MTSRPRCSPMVTKGRVCASGRRQASLSTGHQGNQATRMRREAKRAPMASDRVRQRSLKSPGESISTTQHPGFSSPTVQHLHTPSGHPGARNGGNPPPAVGRWYPHPPRSSAPSLRPQHQPGHPRSFGCQHQALGDRPVKGIHLRNNPPQGTAAQRLLHGPQHVGPPPQSRNNQQPPRFDPVPDQPRQVEVIPARQPHERPRSPAGVGQEGRHRSQSQSSSPTISWTHPARSPPPGRAPSISGMPSDMHAVSASSGISIWRISRRSASSTLRFVFGI